MIDINVRIKTYIQRLKPVWLVLLTTLLLLLLETLFTFLCDGLKIPHGRNFGTNLPTSHFWIIPYLIYVFIAATILAPIFETFIFQYLIHQVLCVKFKLKKMLFIFSGAFIFGLTHYSYYSTMIVTSVICIVFNYIYVVLIETERKKKAYMIIASIHSALNAFVFIDLCIDLYINK